MTAPTDDHTDRQALWKFQDLLWESGLWEELNHDQLIKLDKVVDAYTEQKSVHNQVVIRKDELKELLTIHEYAPEPVKDAIQAYYDVRLRVLNEFEKAQLKASTREGE